MTHWMIWIYQFRFGHTKARKTWIPKLQNQMYKWFCCQNRFRYTDSKAMNNNTKFSFLYLFCVFSLQFAFKLKFDSNYFAITLIWIYAWNRSRWVIECVAVMQSKMCRHFFIQNCVSTKQIVCLLCVVECWLLITPKMHLCAHTHTHKPLTHLQIAHTHTLSI